MNPNDKADSAATNQATGSGAAPASNPTSAVSAPTLVFDSSTAAIANETSSLNEASTVPLQTLIGITLDTRYFIEKELGRGGVGAVYLARDRKLHDKRVVIKVLLDKSLQNSWVVQKFQQEKEALARVDHPGVVGILDTGELPDGKPYLVMQFIDGVTLRSQIKPEGIPLDGAAELIKQIGRALSAAHDKGILHRDLKPENVMLQSLGGGEEQVKIIDFGIAKLKDSIIAPSTATGATAGTVSYMAPEQLSGRAVSAATDTYALGAIAHEMVTGRKPFNPETGFELLEMQRGGVRVKPVDLRPSLTEEASQIILRALSFDPKERFQSARELGDALARALTSDTDHKRVDQAQIPATELSTGANAPARQTGDLASKTLAARYEPAQVQTLAGSVYPAALENDSPPRRTWLKVGVGLILIAAVVAAASVLIWKRNALFGNRNANIGASLPERSLAYSLTVQKMRYGKPFQDTFESSGQEIFENGWKFRMNLSSPQEGYLYLLNEGPAAGDSTTYNVLFPEARTNAGSPRVSAEQKLQTAWMRFDEHQGTEKFWLVWSASPVKELDAATDSVNEKDQ
ncbi:MAG TPA: serine/threonine-protein kinase, partial [Pyrinomonadaceae bacterium]|nr:serine/threonine-protein kinase [Pyrinomonadaceae bacterium]